MGSEVQNDPLAPLVDRLLCDLACCDLVAWDGRDFLEASFWGKLSGTVPNDEIRPGVDSSFSGRGRVALRG